LELALLLVAAALAGFIDSIVGGGGLIQLPSLFAVYPAAPTAMLLGTNKGAAIWGTSLAAVQYARRVRPVWSTLLPAAASALVFSFLGALAATYAPPEGLRKLLPFLLCALLFYTLRQKELGQEHAPRFGARQEALAAALIAALLGFYDGFFGPGTGSFFIFFFVRVLGYDFLRSSAAAKILNGATNLAALVLFARTGNLWLEIAGLMAVANVLGSLLGSRLALARGSRFVRRMFIGVVLLLILRTTWDAFLR
jgi:uncharacterized protein